MDVRHFKPDPVIDDPRPYQVQILTLAKQKNVIVYLGTGTGKTLIAVLLIKHMIEKELELVLSNKQLGVDVPPRIAFFLVTTVPLVFQQAGVVQSNLSASTGKYCGEMGVDYWDAAKWAKELSTHNVIVCTAKIMENLLHMGYITMDKINLIIFDECHNAVGNSPYNSIMKNFYATSPPALRPKILGLTASPINSGLEYSEAKINNILRTLEKTLDCQVITAGNNAELQRYVPTAQEILCEHDPCPMAKDIKARLEPLLYMYPDIMTLINVILDYVGVWGVYFYFSQAKEEDLSAHGFDISWVTVIHELCRQYMSDPDGTTINPSIDTSAKFQSLVYLLTKMHDDTPVGQKFCGIVFSKRRLVATLLNLALMRIPGLPEKLQSAALVGHGQRKGKPDLEGYEGMSFREQCEIIGRFRKHELNLLISTSLLEEGLDIPSCRLVVRYDIPDTLIAHVQSRGRARHQNSQYVLSVERNSPATVAFVQQLRKMELAMQTLRRDPNKVFEDDDESEDGPPVQYVVPSTRAVMTYPSSLEKLHQYCSTLPTDQYTKLLPTFTLLLDSMHGFQYKVTLPANSPVKEAEGKIHRKKILAKQSAAFCVCIKLHEDGLLNDHLLPPKPKRLFRIEDPNSKLGSKKSVREYAVDLPAVFTPSFTLASAPSTIFVMELFISGTALFQETQFGVITRYQMPPKDFRVRINGQERQAQFRNSTMLAITPEQYKCAHQFHTVLFSHLHRSTLFEPQFANEHDHQLPYIVVPLKQKQIDWEAASKVFFPLQTVRERLAAKLPMEDLTIVHAIEYQRKYTITKVRDDLTVNSPLPSSKKNKSLAEKMTRRFHVKFTDTEQPPILEIAKIPNPTNVVSPDTDPSLKSRSRCMPYASPEYCYVLPFSVSLYHSALFLPSILLRMETSACGFEIATVMRLPSPMHSIWAQALTCSSFDTKTNYQRLEFLGDSALKYILSKHLFLANPTLHEGILSQMRAQLCCNRFLFEKATEKGLAKYISSQPLNVRGWNPNKNRTSQLSDKTIADVVESIIGASFLLGEQTRAQENNALETAIAFGFPIDPSSYPAAVANILSQQSDQHLVLSKFAIDVLGYEFLCPSLLVTSFTHASKISPTGDCYQRLEFLGDAIADLLVVKYLYREYPTIDPGALTLLKMTVVSNKTFSLLAYYHGFYKYIEHNSSMLISTLVEFGKYVQGELLEKPLTLQDISALIEDPECDPPKILSDIFEALVAAIYLDCGMDLDTVWAVLQKLILPFMREFVHPGSHEHPVSKLTHILQQAGCQGFDFSSEEDSPNSCTIKLHGQTLTTVYGKNKKTSKMMAAKNAVSLLTSTPSIITRLCTCQPTKADN